MRYIKIPAPVKLIDPMTDTPADVEQSFAQAVRAVCTSLMQKQLLDTLDIIDLREKLGKAKVGDEVPIDSAWWAPLRDEFKRPSVFGPAYLLAASSHIKAVLDAKEQPSPAAIVAKVEDPVVEVVDSAAAA